MTSCCDELLNYWERQVGLGDMFECGTNEIGPIQDQFQTPVPQKQIYYQVQTKIKHLPLKLASGKPLLKNHTCIPTYINN